MKPGIFVALVCLAFACITFPPLVIAVAVAAVVAGIVKLSRSRAQRRTRLTHGSTWRQYRIRQADNEAPTTNPGWRLP